MALDPLLEEGDAQMDPIVEAFLLIGGLGLIGLVADLLGRRTAVPRVTLMLVIGFLAGPGGFDLLPHLSETWFTAVANIALVMVGFLLGGELELATLREHGRSVVVWSLAVVVATLVVIALGLGLLGVEPGVAMLLAAIACSTDPAASADVMRVEGARGPFTRTLVGIVAIDDAWGLIVFSLVAVTVHAMYGHAEGGMALVGSLVHELGGALLLGAALGVPLAYLSGRIRPGEPTLAEALGMVFLCGGLALWWEVSFLLAAMSMGAVAANLATHHNRPFRAIAGIEWPFLIAFFVLAGAALEPQALLAGGLIGLAYIALRVLARVLGGTLGAVVLRRPASEGRWLGLALLPQAGVALGMALVATRSFPELDGQILTLTIAATVVFELVGPLLLRVALRRVGETGAYEEDEKADEA